MTRPEIAGISPFIIVSNVPATLAFYRERLGFEVTFQGADSEDIFFGIVRRGDLLYRKHFRILAVASLPGTVMPVADAWLAYQASAGDQVVLKHVATALFLIITFAILRSVVRRGQSA